MGQGCEPAVFDRRDHRGNTWTKMQAGTKVENRNIRRGPSMAWLVAIPVPSPGYEFPVGPSDGTGESGERGERNRERVESIVVVERVH